MDRNLICGISSIGIVLFFTWIYEIIKNTHPESFVIGMIIGVFTIVGSQNIAVSKSFKKIMNRNRPKNENYK